MTGIPFERLFRASIYLMLTLASFALSVDSTTDNPIAMAYPLFTIFLAIWTYTKVDTGRSKGLSRNKGVVLALLSIPLVIAEVRIGWRYLQSDLLVLALGHWLLYLVWIKMSMPKSVEDDWFLFLLGLVLVLTAAVLSQSDVVGQTIFLWAIVSLWALTLFHLEREAARARNPHLSANLPAEARIKTLDQPYQKIFDRPFFWSGLRVVGTALLMSVFVFLLMPRGDSMRLSQRAGAASRHLTGFDENVKLGQLGEILENDAVVLTVEFFDSNGKATLPEQETYWRGITMAEYQNGQWNRQPVNDRYFPRNMNTENTLRQKIRQEATDSSVVFGLRPVISARSLMRFRSPITINTFDGTMSRRPYNGVYEYEIYSSKDPSAIQPGELVPKEQILSLLTSLPDSLKSELKAITEPLIANVSPTDTLAQAKAVTDHFFDPATYAYSLEQTRIDTQIDPVLDFLKNRKEGHCEYFASALALMLRSIGIPTRLVNGFKGGDWNSLGQVMYVREKYAHAWVEAYVSSGPGEPPRWVTLDPTPANEREKTIASTSIFNKIRQGTDFIRYVWVFYIIGFDAERQSRVIYEPIIALFREAKTGFMMIIQAIRDFFSGTRKFSDLLRGFSAVGFFGGILLTVLAIVMLQIGRKLVTFFLNKFITKNQKKSLTTPGIAIYQRLESLLSELDLKRSQNETPQEFSRRVGLILKERFTETGLEGIPDIIVKAFYQIRFGAIKLENDDIDSLNQQLNLLENKIHNPLG